MSSLYDLEDWSINPCKKLNLSLREVIKECTALEEYEIAQIACLKMGETYEGSEFNIFCTSKTA